MNIDIQKLQADAQSCKARLDHFGMPGWMTVRPEVLLELIAEIERITGENQRLRAGVESDLAEIDRIQGVYDAHFRKTRSYRMQRDRAKDEADQLKAENEALRKLKLPDYLKLSDEMREAGEHAESRAIEDQCCSIPVLKGVFFEAAIQSWLNHQQEAIDAAMSKEASHD